MYNLEIKGNISVVLSDPPFKDGYFRLTRVHVKTLSCQESMFIILKTDSVQLWFLKKSNLRISILMSAL